MGPPEISVFVPMLLDVYINYPPPASVAADLSQPGKNQAYLSPVPQPKFASPTTENALVQHDIFEDAPELPYIRGRGDPSRVTDGRSGIYVSWRLPSHYRTGMTASSEDAKFDLKLAEGGYPSVNTPGSTSKGTRFRDVPNRWVVCRTVTPLQNGSNIMMAKPLDTLQGVTFNDQRPWKKFIYGTTDSNGSYTKRDVFIVESDTVRHIESLSELEDIEIRSSPFIDEKLSITQQSQSFLGHSMPLEVWDADSDMSTKTSTALNVARSSNPFFADFQPQNSSVFSFFDDMTTKLSDISDRVKIKAGQVSYTVTGYHRSPPKTDPLAIALVPGQTALDRLAACRLELKSTVGLDPSVPGGAADVPKLLSIPQPSANPAGSPLPDPAIKLRTLISGTFSNILYSCSDTQQVPQPMNSPGNDLQDAFIRSHPLSVGTNPVDALFGWLRAQPSSQDDVKSQLMRLQSFILDVNDDLDSQLQAEDLLSTNNFLVRPGGTTWHLQAPPGQGGKTPIELPQPIWASVRSLNLDQRLLDGLSREIASLQTQLFFCWWKYVADHGRPTNADLTSIQRDIKTIKGKIQANKSLQEATKASVKTAKASLKNFELKAIVEPNFAIQRDPTLLLAGCKSKWPMNSGTSLDVRVSGQEQSAQPIYVGPKPPYSADAEIWPAMQAKLEPIVAEGVYSLLQEAQRLAWLPESSWTNSFVNPKFHGQGDTYQNENGWFPLFIEWQIEYYDIPWDCWEFGPCGPESRLEYRIKADKILSDPALGIQGDYRIIKGRSPILPQASATLQATLKQVFAKINPDQLKGVLGSIDPDSLLKAALDLDYLSTPMLGLTEQLTTRMSEAHFVPVTFQDGKLKVAEEAKLSGSELQIDENDWIEMAAAMKTTPFASLVDLPADIDKYCPFKPVTHGQFRFTKLNVVDKFGQVVAGIDRVMNSQGTMTHNPLFPCLGEAYSLEYLADSSANAVMKRNDSWCSFVQLPPSINQPARVNASFVTHYDSVELAHSWRRVEEWENPVKGWIVINSANVSLQIFTADGRFVREYCVLNGQIAKRPFAADDSTAKDVDPLMQQLLGKFDTSPTYLLSTFQSISTTVQSVQANPSHYAESMLSILGRPLALTTFGVSLELASPPYTDQSTFKSARDDHPNPNTPHLLDYPFSIKIGDGDNVFDGLYGLFPEIVSNNPGPAQFDMSTFYSYHASDPQAQPPIIHCKPFYPSPSTQSNYTAYVDSQLQVFAALVDPFTAIHCYSALLPIKQLRIPSWAVDRGISRLASFFKKGPTLIPTDVPPFHPDTPSTTYVVSKDLPLGAPQPAQTGTIPVPAVGVGEWNWLQPYAVDGGDGTEQEVKYNELGITRPEEKPRWVPGPYVVTEGYLQMKKPFTAPDPVSAPDLVLAPGPVLGGGESITKEIDSS